MRAFVDRWAQKRPVLVLTLMIFYSVQSLIITASKRGSAQEFTYDATMAVLLAEALKLGFSLSMMSPEDRAAMSLASSMPYAVPALLYTLQNRLVFEALRHISPPEYQLLNNLKLFTTALMYRLVMRRQLSVQQWFALLLLCLGMTLATVPCGGIEHNGTAEAADVWIGTFIMFVNSWFSASAGVVNEWLIKRSKSVMEANTWLYTYGVLAAVVQLCVLDGENARVGGYLRGFNESLLPWAVVICNAVLGQTIAFLFKYADSIIKLYAVCAAMALTAVISSIFFGFHLQFHAAAGYVLSVLSMCLYNLPPDVLKSSDSEVIGRLLERKPDQKTSTKKE
eukprot:TRINITY_DN79286_c0_g1_i1.p1 TRINITY_DN79286_c0_g1~~TRINITY_DN79286_c0_g1_i1.p1  ORF type:complete len:349 (+),score=72.02 TRINITY_DN79286_c0_g1_i1:34-1047(+)